MFSIEGLSEEEGEDEEEFSDGVTDDILRALLSSAAVSTNETSKG